jgi:hypothetical protein
MNPHPASAHDQQRLVSLFLPQSPRYVSLGEIVLNGTLLCSVGLRESDSSTKWAYQPSALLQVD